MLVVLSFVVEGVLVCVEVDCLSIVDVRLLSEVLSQHIIVN